MQTGLLGNSENNAIGNDIWVCSWDYDHEKWEDLYPELYLICIAVLFINFEEIIYIVEERAINEKKIFAKIHIIFVKNPQRFAYKIYRDFHKFSVGTCVQYPKGFVPKMCPTKPFVGGTVESHKSPNVTPNTTEL